MSRIIQGLNLARMSYAQAYKIQKSILRAKITDTNKEDIILFVEHNPVYTVGLRRSEYSDEFVKSLKNLNASFEYTDRGGLVTFHGPGQLVAYPIFYLKNHTIGLKDYVKSLECFEKAIQLEPLELNYQNWKAAVFIKLREYERALDCYEAAIRIDPDNVARESRQHVLNELI